MIKDLLVKIWKSICDAFQWYLDLPNTTEVTLELMSIIMIPVVAFLFKRIMNYRKSDKFKARSKLKEYNHSVIDLINKERVFFNEEDNKGFLFYENVPLKVYNADKKVCLEEVNSSSYLLIGEAGCGKQLL